jgi:hypothetical protein
MVRATPVATSSDPERVERMSENIEIGTRVITADDIPIALNCYWDKEKEVYFRQVFDEYPYEGATPRSAPGATGSHIPIVDMASPFSDLEACLDSMVLHVTSFLGTPKE